MKSKRVVVLEAPEDEALYEWDRKAGTLLAWLKDADEPVVRPLHPQKNNPQGAYRAALSHEITRTASTHEDARRHLDEIQ